MDINLTIPKLIALTVLFALMLLHWAYEQTKIKNNLVEKLYCNTKIQKCAYFFVIIASFLFPYWVATFGLNFHDTFYDLNLFKHYKENCGFSTFGTSQLGYLFYNIANGNVVFIQWITIFLFQISILTPIITIKKTREYKIGLSKIAYIALLSSVIISFSNFYMSYDSFTVLLMSLLLSVLILYDKYKMHSLLILAGILSGYSISIRFPNLMIILFISFSLFLYEIVLKKEWIGLLKILEYVLFSIATFCLLCLIQYSSFDNVFNDINTTMSGDESHGIVTMGKSYIYGLLDIAMFVGIIVIYYISSHSSTKSTKNVVPFVFMFTILMLTYTMAGGCYNGIKLMMSALTITLLLFLIIHQKDYFLAFAIFSCFFATIFGSNTGVLRLCNIVALPLLFYIFMQQHSDKKLLISFVIPLLLFLPVMFFSYTIVDGGLIHLNTQIKEIPEISMVRTTETRAQLVRKAQQIIDSETKSGKKVVCVGSERHLFNYINNLDDPFKEFSEKFDNDKFIDRCIDFYNKEQNTCFIIVKPMSAENETKIEQRFNNQNIEYQIIYIDE